MGVVAWSKQEFELVVLCVLLVMVGLAVAGYADKRLDNLRKAQEQKQAEIGANWKGNELVAGVRWMRWSLLTLSVSTFPCAILTLEKNDGSRLTDSPIVLFACLFLLLLTCRLVWLAWHAARAGYLLRMSASGGLDHCHGLKIAWRDILGVDMRTVESRGIKSHSLVLALSTSAVEALRRPYLRRVCAAPPFQLDVSQAQLVIPCGLIAAPPAVLRGAAHCLAMRANPDFMPSWKYFWGKETIALHKNCEQAEKTMAETRVLLDRLVARGDRITDAEIAETEAQLEKVLAQTKLSQVKPQE